jgi:hypothetical protein
MIGQINAVVFTFLGSGRMVGHSDRATAVGPSSGQRATRTQRRPLLEEQLAVRYNKEEK